MTETEDQVAQNHSADEEEEAYVLSPRLISAALYAVEVGDRDQLVALMEPLHGPRSPLVFSQRNR